jgi:hypothetical protein
VIRLVLVFVTLTASQLQGCGTTKETPPLKTRAAVKKEKGKAKVTLKHDSKRKSGSSLTWLADLKIASAIVIDSDLDLNDHETAFSVASAVRSPSLPLLPWSKQDSEFLFTPASPSSGCSTPQAISHSTSMPVPSVLDAGPSNNPSSSLLSTFPLAGPSSTMPTTFIPPTIPQKAPTLQYTLSYGMLYMQLSDNLMELKHDLWG